jgi:hypothetical protein
MVMRWLGSTVDVPDLIRSDLISHLSVVPQGILQGDEEHVSGWDLVYDNNGYIEIDRELCGYCSFLGGAVPVPAGDLEEEEAEAEEQEGGQLWRKEAARRRPKLK